MTGPGTYRNLARFVPGCVGAVVALWCCASALQASETSPEFSDCLNTQIAYFERDFGPSATTPRQPGFQNGLFDWVDYCGMVGIIACDYAAEPLTCQRDLRAELDGLSSEILTELPAPENVQGQAEQWSDALYPRVWALAHGSSAGEDCAGSGEEAMQVWCEARQATSRLSIAITAWQVARYLNAAEPAIVAGWAEPPAPMRPRARDDKDAP